MKKATFLLLLTSLCRLAFGQVDIHLHPSNTFVNMVMSPEDYADWKDNDRFSAESTYKTNLTNQLYAKFEDDFDFIIFLLNEPNIPANINYYGKHYTVSNEIEGIGKPIYSNAPSYGSTEKLKGVVQMTKKNYLTDGPFLHELSHQWGNSILTTGALNNNNYAGHWGFTGDVSEGQLGGFDQSTLIENVDGISNKYSVTHFGINANGGNTVLYSQKELYVMGLIPASEIPDFDLFRDITSSQVIDGKNVFIADTKIEYTGAKIVSENGERVPSYTTSQKEFKILTVLLSDHKMSDTELEEVYEGLKSITHEGEGANNASYNFWEATGGRATLNADAIHLSLKDENKITILSQNEEGEIALNNSTVDIQWESSITGDVKIELYNNNSFVDLLATDVASGDGSFPWNVPTDYPAMSLLRIKITSLSDSTQFDFSDALFISKAPLYSLTGSVTDKYDIGVENVTVTAGEELTLDQAQTERSYSFFFPITRKDNYTQSFSPTYSTLSEIEVYLKKDGVPAKDVVFSILDSTYQEIGKSNVLANDITTTGSWIRVNFIPLIALDPNQTYYISVSGENEGEVNTIYWTAESSSAYTRGSTNIEAQYPGLDFMFKTWGGNGYSTETDENGNYQLQVPLGWTGDLSANFSNELSGTSGPTPLDYVNTNIDELDFSILGPFIFSGFVFDQNMLPIEGAKVLVGEELILDQHQTTISNLYSGSRLYQTFKPTGAELGQIDLNIRKSNAPDDDLIVSLYNSENQLVRQELLPQETIADLTSFHSILFFPAVPVTIGETYKIELTSNKTQGTYFWAGTNGDLYPNGGTNISGDNEDFDFSFKTWSGNGSSTNTAADGSYSIQIPFHWSGNINASTGDSTALFATKIISTLSEDRSQENFVKDLNVGLFSGTESATNVQLFPNPIHNTLNIQLHERLESNTKVIISNTEGQIVSESFVNPGIENIVLDISNLSSGVYAVTISNDGFTHSELITKTN